MKRRRMALAMFIMIFTLYLSPDPVYAQGPYVTEAISGLQDPREPVYVSPAAGQPPSVADQLKAQLSNGDHIAIAIMPTVAISETKTVEEFALAVVSALGREAILVVMIGEHMAAQSSDGLPAGKAMEIAKSIQVEISTPDSLAALSQFIKAVHKYQATHSEQDIGSKGFDMPFLLGAGVIVVVCILGVGFVISKVNRARADKDTRGDYIGHVDRNPQYTPGRASGAPPSDRPRFAAGATTTAPMTPPTRILRMRPVDHIGSPLQPTDPRQIGPYRTLRRIGTGGMSIVFLGEDTRSMPPNRSPYAAVKIIHQHLLDETLRKRLDREFQAAEQVVGPHTIRMIDHDTAAPIPWLSNEFVDAPNLATVVRQASGQLPLATQVRILQGAVDGLASIHAHNIVHRDIKPENVLWVPDTIGTLIIDFGIALMLDATRITHTSVIVATPGYTAPECLRSRDRQEITPACDVYSLGSLMCFIATGSSAFGSGTFEQVMKRVVQGTFSTKGVPGPLRSIADSCLRPHPRQRPTLADIQQRLAKIQP